MKKIVSISFVVAFFAFVIGALVGSFGSAHKAAVMYKARSIERVCPYCNDTLQPLENIENHKGYCMPYNDMYEALHN